MQKVSTTVDTFDYYLNITITPAKSLIFL
jgi:hypothetical protein